MRHLIDLRGDQSQPLFGQPKKVDWNVERLVDANLAMIRRGTILRF
jgi:hypothetical protein